MLRKQKLSLLCGTLASIILATNLSAGIITQSGDGFTIPDYNFSGISSDITISQNETITSLEVTLRGFAHGFAGDIHAEISNGSIRTFLVGRVGRPDKFSDGDDSAYNGDYTFSDDGGDLWAAASSAAFGVDIAAGDYKATGNFNSPVSLADAYAGQSSAATWTLRMTDSGEANEGLITGWEIKLLTTDGSSNTVPEPTSMTVFAIGVVCFLNRSRRKRRQVDRILE